MPMKYCQHSEGMNFGTAVKMCSTLTCQAILNATLTTHDYDAFPELRRRDEKMFQHPNVVKMDFFSQIELQPILKAVFTSVKNS
jgi:hypothetical protein